MTKTSMQTRQSPMISGTKRPRRRLPWLRAKRNMSGNIMMRGREKKRQAKGRKVVNIHHGLFECFV